MNSSLVYVQVNSDRLKKRGALSAGDVDTALREIRVALLEADVALPVVKDFIEAVRARAVGEEVIRSVTPGQMVVKIVHDHLTSMLGSEASAINLAAAPPAANLMVGLQGSGKTTTTAKIAVYLRDKLRKKEISATELTQAFAVREENFPQQDAELLQHIANQIAIGVENALAYRQVVERANNHISHQKIFGGVRVTSPSSFKG
jgi:signal recognition particle GTPase